MWRDAQTLVIGDYELRIFHVEVEDDVRRFVVGDVRARRLVLKYGGDGIVVSDDLGLVVREDRSSGTERDPTRSSWNSLHLEAECSELGRAAGAEAAPRRALAQHPALIVDPHPAPAA
jgi:hypothetical protein